LSAVEVRCSGCRLPAVLCMCALLPQLATRTRVVLVMHRNEERKPTNSGLLAARCLVHSEVLLRGCIGQPEPRWIDDPARQPLLLFPHPEARPLDELAASSRPLTLIVPDGTWRQAAKVSQRMPGLDGVPYATLPAGPPSGYRLRATEKGRLSTMEAIARALGIVEGAAVRQALEQVFAVMVARLLWLRGSLPSAQVRGGIPEPALADDPRGRPGSVLARPRAL
jgi:DTW domain-containing protein YfiP